MAAGKRRQALPRDRLPEDWSFPARAAQTFPDTQDCRSPDQERYWSMVLEEPLSLVPLEPHNCHRSRLERRNRLQAEPSDTRLPERSVPLEAGAQCTLDTRSHKGWSSAGNRPAGYHRWAKCTWAAQKAPVPLEETGSNRTTASTRQPISAREIRPTNSCPSILELQAP